MPWEIRYNKKKKGNKKWCVYNKESGREAGCSETKEKAREFQKALYTNADD